MTNDELIEAYEQVVAELIEEAHETAQLMLEQLRNGGRINEDMGQKLAALRAIISSADDYMYKLSTAKARKKLNKTNSN